MKYTKVATKKEIDWNGVIVQPGATFQDEKGEQYHVVADPTDNGWYTLLKKYPLRGYQVCTCWFDEALDFVATQ